MNKYECLWIASMLALLLVGCAEFKEFIGLPSTQDTAQDAVNDAITGNYAGAITKIVGLGVSFLLIVLGAKKGVTAIKAYRAAK